MGVPLLTFHQPDDHLLVLLLFFVHAVQDGEAHLVKVELEGEELHWFEVFEGGDLIQGHLNEPDLVSLEVGVLGGLLLAVVSIHGFERLQFFEGLWPLRVL